MFLKRPFLRQVSTHDAGQKVGSYRSYEGITSSTVGKHGDEQMIAKYVKGQGGNYQKLHSDHQLVLF